MSTLRATNIKGRNNGVAPAMPDGVVVTGVVTATSFSGSLTGDATGLTGTPDITVRNITGVGMTLSGTLSYEDVTNIDSIGIVTAQGGLRATGIITARTGTALTYHCRHPRFRDHYEFGLRRDIEINKNLVNTQFWFLYM